MDEFLRQRALLTGELGQFAKQHGFEEAGALVVELRQWVVGVQAGACTRVDVAGFRRMIYSCIGQRLVDVQAMPDPVVDDEKDAGDDER